MTKLDTMTPVVLAGGMTYVGLTIADLRAHYEVPEAAILAGVQKYFRAEVDATAERLRGAITTPGTGQAMEYQEAQAQAFAALANPTNATPGAYPMLAASIGLDLDPSTGAPALDVVGVARSIEAAYALWLSAGAAIRRARLEAKAAISAAANVDAALSAFEAVSWPHLG